jgi:hypothetical protein
MKHSEVLKITTEVFELLESKNLSNDDMQAITGAVLGRLAVEKMMNDMKKKDDEVKADNLDIRSFMNNPKMNN